MLTYNKIKIEHKPQDECILIRFNQYDYDIDEMRDIFTNIQSQFKGKTVVCVPNNIDFEFLDRDQLIKDLESTIEYVKAGPNNEDLH